MNGIGSMKSERQAPAANFRQQRQEMSVRLKQEGVIVPGDVSNPQLLMPIDEFLHDLLRLPQPKTRFQVPGSAIIAL